MEIDPDYTSADHVFRDEDQYAFAKYKWTLQKLRRTKIEKSEEVLNIGCGAGTFNRLAASDGYRVTAFEPDPVVYDIAKRESPDSVKVFNVGLFDVAATGTAGVVVMHDVLEHIADDEHAISHLAHLLKTDGLLILSVPACRWLFGLHDEKLGHFRRYKRRELTQKLNVSFKVERARFFGFTAIPIVFWFSRLKRRPYPVESASSGALSKFFKLICWLETRIIPPVGTSLLVIARRR